jgi:hypothetical protein
MRRRVILSSSDTLSGFEEDWGRFSLAELMAARGPLGLPIEREPLRKRRSARSNDEWRERFGG